MSAAPDSPPDRKDESPPERLHRRGFFTQGLRHLLRPLADIVEQRMQEADLAAWSDAAGDGAGSSGARYGSSAPYPAGGSAAVGSEAPSRTLLRPPGALPEGEFLARCTTCARCVEVCPVAAIKIFPHPEPQRDRKPAIDPSIQACVVCDDLACMQACPTGALRRLTRDEIRMGIAVLRRDICVRSQGEDCQICVDKCPIGPSAIEIPHAGAEVVVKEACVGCGVCEMYCPTSPRAIVVEPLESETPPA